jgi:uncharacterized protein (DUF927 family)
MNSDVPLMTIDGNKQFIPPKVDTDKNCIASHASDDEKKKEAIEKRAVEKLNKRRRVNEKYGRFEQQNCH